MLLIPLFLVFFAVTIVLIYYLPSDQVVEPTSIACEACGYDLHGLARRADVCPECGHPIPASPSSPVRKLDRATLAILGVVLTLAGLLALTTLISVAIYGFPD